MKIIIDVVDFGHIEVSKSRDNDDCFSLTLVDEDSNREHFDLSREEMAELRNALDLIVRP